MGYTTFKQYLVGRGGFFVGALFILTVGLFMAPEDTAMRLFPFLFGIMPLAVPAVLLSLWLADEKKHQTEIRQRVKAALGFWSMLVATTLLFALADILIYKAGVGAIVSSYLALLIMGAAFVGISALALVIFKNPALKTLGAVIFCFIFYQLTAGEFIAISSGMIGLTDAVYLLSFAFGAMVAAFILATRKAWTVKVMQMICLVIILVSGNLIVKPLDSSFYLDWSMGKQFSVKEDVKNQLLAITKPVTITLFLPKQVMLENPNTKAMARIFKRYMNDFSKNAGGMILFKDLTGVAKDGDFAVIIADDEGKEDYIFLPGTNKTAEFEKALLQKVLKAGGVPEIIMPKAAEAKKLDVMEQDKAVLLWNVTTGIYFGLFLIWAVAFVLYKRRQGKAGK